MEMTPLNIALILLACAGVWAVAELALTLRTTRRKLDELTTSVNETISEVTPIVTKLDGAVDELNPALKQVEPLLEKVGTAVDAVSMDLVRVDDILADVSKVSGAGAGAASGAVRAVNRVTDSVGDAGSRLFSRIGRGNDAPTDEAVAPQLSPTTPDGQAAAAVSPEDDAPANRSYFTYPATVDEPEPEPAPANKPAAKKTTRRRTTKRSTSGRSSAKTTKKTSTSTRAKKSSVKE